MMSTNKDATVGQQLSQCCHMCSRIFQNQLKLKYHLSEVHKRKQCKLCYRYIKNRMSVHYEKFHPNIVYQCNICNKIFNDNYKLRYHVCIKNFPPQFKCDYCEKLFYYNFQLRQHVLNVHKKSFVTCYKCGSRVKSKRSHKRHCQKILIFKCDKCKTVFYSQAKLIEHINTQHNNVEETVYCEICGKDVWKTSLLLHNNMHLQEKLIKFKCSDCGKEFRMKKSLNIHVLTHLHEPHLILKNYQCHLCPKNFFHKQVLEEHLNIHSGICKYKCSFCDKAFYTKRNLETHAATHSDKKEFLCNLCTSAFFTKRALVWHSKCKHELKVYYDERKRRKESSKIEKTIEKKMQTKCLSSNNLLTEIKSSFDNGLVDPTLEVTQLIEPITSNDIALNSKFKNNIAPIKGIKIDNVNKSFVMKKSIFNKKLLSVDFSDTSDINESNFQLKDNISEKHSPYKTRSKSRSNHIIDSKSLLNSKVPDFPLGDSSTNLDVSNISNFQPDGFHDSSNLNTEFESTIELNSISNDFDNIIENPANIDQFNFNVNSNLSYLDDQCNKIIDNDNSTSNNDNLHNINQNSLKIVYSDVSDLNLICNLHNDDNYTCDQNNFNESIDLSINLPICIANEPNIVNDSTNISKNGNNCNTESNVINALQKGIPGNAAFNINDTTNQKSFISKVNKLLNFRTEFNPFIYIESAVENNNINFSPEDNINPTIINDNINPTTINNAINATTINNSINSIIQNYDINTTPEITNINPLTTNYSIDPSIKKWKIVTPSNITRVFSNSTIQKNTFKSKISDKIMSNNISESVEKDLLVNEMNLEDVDGKKKKVPTATLR